MRHFNARVILDLMLFSLGIIYNQFGIIQVLQRSPIPQTSNWSGTFFAVSYSKPALEIISTQCCMAEDAVKLRDTSIASAD